jgi:hypothetical protein
MADIRDIHHALHGISQPFHSAFQKILKEECAEIPEVGEIIYRRPAGIEANGFPLYGLKCLHPAIQGVEKVERWLRHVALSLAENEIFFHPKKTKDPFTLSTGERGSSKRTSRE